MSAIVSSISRPFRVDLTGGFSDLPGFSETQPVTHINLAISMAATAYSVQPGTTALQPIVAAVAERLGIAPPHDVDVAFTGVRGAGLGSSAAAFVAVAAYLVTSQASSTSCEDIAEIAAGAERASGNPCGCQDHYAAAFGGFHEWMLAGDRLVSYCALDHHSSVPKLIARLLVVRSNARPLPRRYVRDIGDRIARRERVTIEVLRELDALARELGDDIRGDASCATEILRAIGTVQRRLEPLIFPPDIDALAHSLGPQVAIKACGAGGAGSHFLILAPDGEVDDVRAVCALAGHSCFTVDRSR